jgi:hypothetical protein
MTYPGRGIMNLIENAQEREANKMVTVMFNKNQHITLEQRKYTGIELKQAAIQQGVLIQLSYVLFEVKHNGRRVIIGDHDIVRVNKESEFAAVADDDNS